MGRRNLLTTASSGSDTGLQVISDRLEDNLSIVAGHHGTGDNGAGEDEGTDGEGDGEREDGEVEERGECGGRVRQSFAMFECKWVRASE